MSGPAGRMLFAALIAGLVAGPADAAGPGEGARPVVSEIVSPEAGTGTDYVGVVAARTEVDLGFPLIGRIATRDVDLGDRVRQGDVLARLDPEDLDSARQSAAAGVGVAEAQLRSARDAVVRTREMVRRGTDSATRRDDAERALVAAEARLDQARATLARAEDARRHGDLTAPADGVVVAVFAEPGATLAAGAPVLRLAGIEAREVILDLSETDLADLPDAARFAVRLIADPALTAEARLTRIDPVAGRSTRTRRLHLTLVAPPPAFRLGALVRARAQHDQSAAINLPEGALIKPAGGGTAVWLVRREAPAGAGTEAEGTVSLRTVVPGPAFGDRLRILDGLTPGDEVVVKGVHSLVEGQRVGRRLAP